MVKKIFWQDPYLTELETTVQTVQNNKITVAETIFYAFSGGQESDSGTIEDYKVLIAQKEGKEIVYTLEENHLLKIGDTVKIIIDWKRRYQLIRLHFAAELVLALVYRKFYDIIKVGAHIAANKARIDFEWKESMSPFIEALRQEVQNIIDANHAIISAFSDEENERRYWKISGFSQVPCGGTHIRCTGEIGSIQLKRKNPGKGQERIEVFVDP